MAKNHVAAEPVSPLADACMDQHSEEAAYGDEKQEDAWAAVNDHVFSLTCPMCTQRCIFDRSSRSESLKAAVIGFDIFRTRNVTANDFVNATNSFCAVQLHSWSMRRCDAGLGRVDADNGVHYNHLSMKQN